MKLDTKKKVILLDRIEEEKKRQLIDLSLFYKSNKESMVSKVKKIYKEVIKSGTLNQDIVNLNFTSFSRTKIDQLQYLLPYFNKIKVLKLWKCNIGAGIKNICIHLSGISNLEILSLEDNSFSQTDSDYISVSIAKLKNLKELWLHINDLGPVGAYKISSSLVYLKNLEKLGLDENLIEDGGATSIFESTKSLQNLKFLGLGYNLISEEVCSKILECPSITRLQKIVLSGNRLTQSSSEKFKNILINTSIIL